MSLYKIYQRAHSSRNRTQMQEDNPEKGRENPEKRREPRKGKENPEGIREPRGGKRENPEKGKENLEKERENPEKKEERTHTDENRIRNTRVLPVDMFHFNIVWVQIIKCTVGDHTGSPL